MDEPAKNSPRSQDESVGMAVAVLLAIAAVVAALIGGRAAMLNDRGGDALTTAVREDVREGARIVGDVRRLYEEDAAVALRIAEEQILSELISEAAQSEDGDVRAILLAEARSDGALAEVLSKPSKLAAGDPQRAVNLSGGDLLQRLAEIRTERSDELKNLDPAATTARGEAELTLSVAMLAAIVPVAVAFLLGAVAGAVRRRRRALLTTGYGFVAVGLALAVFNEVLL